MTTSTLKLSKGGRRGLIELGRAARKLPGSRQAVAVQAEGVVEAADEVLVLVVSKIGTLVRSMKVHGRVLDARELRLRLAGAETAVDEIVRVPRRGAEPQLTTAEASMLDEAGLPEGRRHVPDALERARIELGALVRESLTIDEAAKALGVSTSRLRQRLSPRRRTLYGIREGRSWRIPRFQFESRNKLVRGIDLVLPHVRSDAHPLAVKNWFTTPHQDLVADDDERVTPNAWLSAGRPADIVAELAEEI